MARPDRSRRRRWRDTRRCGCSSSARIAAQPAFRGRPTQNAIAVAESAGAWTAFRWRSNSRRRAYARCRSSKIATRLADRFRLLTGGDRTALPRQQTLRALIDWSYDLLNRRERVLFRRLAVFAGGWTLEAAEAVVRGRRRSTGTMCLRCWRNLVEKSLVILESESGRYRMLDTVRQYAQERLDESGEADERARGISRFISRFAEKARPELFGPEQARMARATRSRAREPAGGARVVLTVAKRRGARAGDWCTRSSPTWGPGACPDSDIG